MARCKATPLRHLRQGLAQHVTRAYLHGKEANNRRISNRCNSKTRGQAEHRYPRKIGRTDEDEEDCRQHSEKRQPKTRERDDGLKNDQKHQRWQPENLPHCAPNRCGSADASELCRDGFQNMLFSEARHVG